MNAAKATGTSLGYLGMPLVRAARYSVQLFLMIYLCVRTTVSEQRVGLRMVLRVLAAQIYFTGWQAMPLISVLALSTGGLIILNSAGEVTGNLFYIIVVRELGPVVTALVVIARSGTAVASELGNMKANREVDALQVMGIDPLSFVVFPRLMGGVISLLALVFYFDLIAVSGGFLMTRVLHGVSLDFFLDSLADSITGTDVIFIGAKTVMNGLCIFSLCCFQGLQVRHSVHQVPKVTTAAVVLSISFVVLLNLVASALWQIGGGLL